MTWLQIHYSQVLAISAIVQAAATIVLVLVTFAYVLFTKSLADKAQLQAAAAQDQADAAREALDRAFEDGVRQQAQLVQRQAVLGARSELALQLTKNLDWLLHATVEASSLADDESLARLQDPDSVLLRLHADRCRELETTEEACDLGYLDDFVGAFPLSEELTLDLITAGHRVAGALGILDMKMDLASVGMTPEWTEIREVARSLEGIANSLSRALGALRKVVRASGYARAFGALPLDSADTAIATSWVVERGGVWHLGESLRAELIAAIGD